MHTLLIKNHCRRSNLNESAPNIVQIQTEIEVNYLSEFKEDLLSIVGGVEGMTLEEILEIECNLNINLPRCI